jgi:hypothetical protein
MTCNKNIRFLFLFSFCARNLGFMQTKPIPIALPTDLLAQIDQAQQLTGLSKADVMRLCMRIGLVDLRAAEHDFPGIVKRIADDKGISFQSFAHQQSEPFLHGQTRQNPLEFPACTPPTFATPAPSTGISPTKKPPLETANIVTLPPPHVLSSLNDSQTAEPAPTDQRSEASFSKPKPKRKAR